MNVDAEMGVLSFFPHWSAPGSETEDEDELYSIIEKEESETPFKTKETSERQTEMDFLEEEEDEELEHMEVQIFIHSHVLSSC